MHLWPGWAWVAADRFVRGRVAKLTAVNPAKTVFRALLPLFERVAQVIDRKFNQFVQPRRMRGKLVLQPYIGWGTPTDIELTGRVLLPRTMSPAKKGDPRFRNFQNILRRFFSREVGGVKVCGVLDGMNAVAVSDADGYFTLKFSPQEPLPAGWHDAALAIEDREGATRARVQVVDQARFGVISDLDDTVIQSDVTSIPRMVSTVMLGNARTRLPFPGIGAFYRALTKDSRERNPIFYVSSSPWNLFDLLWQFLDYRRIPYGPLFLRNWGMDLFKGHGQYKQKVIERILTKFPHLKFVLVGDSAEQDPEIYADIVARYPGRILAVYIRDVSQAFQSETIPRLRQEVRKAGVDLILAKDSLDAAAHALSLGLITPHQYRSVLSSVAHLHES